MSIPFPTGLLRSFTYLMVFFAFLLVLSGTLVTGGHWLGQEGHMMLANAVGFLSLALALLLQLSASSELVKRAGWTAVGLILFQGLLGLLTVTLRGSVVTVIAHACLGQLYFSWMVCLSVFVSTEGQPPSTAAAPDPRLFRLAAATSGFVLWQLLAGAIYRYTGMGLHFHFLGALLVGVHVILLSRRVLAGYSNEPLLAYPTLALISLVGLQLVLGWFSWRFPTIPVITSHIAVGALILASSLLLTVQTARRQVTA